ncbi:MAG TPA: hypothetical protein VEA79_13655 [Phenylobacterium sp.]|nr:hypothetical protein [Phenylobacterium sp.]
MPRCHPGRSAAESRDPGPDALQNRLGPGSTARLRGLPAGMIQLFGSA